MIELQRRARAAVERRASAVVRVRRRAAAGALRARARARHIPVGTPAKTEEESQVAPPALTAVWVREPPAVVTRSVKQAR